MYATMWLNSSCRRGRVAWLCLLLFQPLTQLSHASYIKANFKYAIPQDVQDKLDTLQHQHVWQTLDGRRPYVADLKLIPQDRWQPPPPQPDISTDADSVSGGEGPSKQARCAGTIGRWCNDWWASDATPPTPAARGNKECANNCNGVGVCNYDIGICQCPAGWQGDDCTKPKKRPCTRSWSGPDSTPGEPMSHINEKKEDLDLSKQGWMASRCAGVCDDIYGGCYCGYGSKHSHIPAPDSAKPGTSPLKIGRPMADGCKPNKDSKGNQIDWGSLPWEQLYGKTGWCEVDAGINPDAHCGCPYDNMGGQLCDQPKMAYCPNQCNLRGQCILGFCKCDEGWYGTTCDKHKSGDDEVIKSPIPQDRLHPGRDTWWKEPYQQAPTSSGRRRPFIYIYDLPAEYNAQFLQYRLLPGHSAWRGFDSDNNTQLNTGVYTLETYFHETLITSKHRTLDPEEADFFYVPMYISAYLWPILGWADGPWWYAPVAFPRPMHSANMVLEAKRWLQKHYPYWARRGGRDHIFLMTHDEGACYMPSEVYNTAIVLTHWGRTDQNHTSGSAYGPDDYNMECEGFPKHQPTDWRELYKGHACYTPGKDLLVPAFKHLESYADSPLLGNVPNKRDILLFLRGDVGLHRLWWYSRGVRQTLYRLSMENRWREKYGVVIGTGSQYSGSYAEYLSRSKFCLVAPGDGWSARSEDAVLNGCIPVLINDNVEPIFHGILDWDKFSVRIPQAQIHKTPQILMAITDKQLYNMQRELANVWARFAYVSGPYHQSVLQDKYESRAALRNSTQLSEHNPYRPLLRYPVRSDAFHTIMQWLASRVPFTRGEEPVVPMTDDLDSEPEGNYSTPL